MELRRLRTEPVMALFCISYYMPMTSFVQNLAMDKSCDDLFGHTRCSQQAQVANFSDAETDAVQLATAQVLLYFNLTSAVPALVLTVVLGHWSDLHGRRLALLLPALGNCISNVLYVVVEANESWPAKSIVWAVLPFGLCGGYSVFMMGMCGWLRDIHPIRALAMRIAINDGVELASGQLGVLGGTQLFTRLGYGSVFGTAAAASAMSVVLVVLFTANENRDIRPSAPWTVKVKDLLHVRSTLETNFRMLTQKRTQDKRTYIWLMYIVVFIGYFNFGGGSEVAFMYTRLRIHWNAIQFSYYVMSIAAAATIGCMVVAPILVRCFRKQPDMTIALVGQLGYFGYHLMVTIATTTIVMYAACSLYPFAALTFISYRAVIAKCINQDEMGKLMGVSTIVQSVSENLGRTVMTRVYMATLATSRPWTSYAIFSALSLSGVCICSWMFLRMSRNRVNLDEDEDTNKKDQDEESNNHGDPITNQK